MAFYDTIPTTVSEDALISGPKAAPLNRKAIALVAAVCFASAVAGTAAPSAVRGLSNLSSRSPKTPTDGFDKQFRIQKDGGPDECMGVLNHNTAGKGSAIELFACQTNDPGQMFRLTNVGTLKYESPSGKQLCVTTNGGQMKTEDCKLGKMSLKVSWTGSQLVTSSKVCMGVHSTGEYTDLHPMDCSLDYTQWTIMEDGRPFYN